MSRASVGNHAAVVHPRRLQATIRSFYRGVLGCEIVRQTDDKDDFRIGGDFFLAVLYEDEAALDEASFGRAMYLELETDDVAGMRQRIVDFGVTVIDIPDPHLYFQAPGGQAFRLVGVDEDLSQYEGVVDHRLLPGAFDAGRDRE